MTRHQKWVLHPSFYPISLALSQSKHTASKLALHVLTYSNKIYTNFAQADAPGAFLPLKCCSWNNHIFIAAYFTLWAPRHWNIMQNIRLKHNADAQQCEIILMSFDKVFIAGLSLMEQKCSILTSDWRCVDSSQISPTANFNKWESTLYQWVSARKM